MELFNTEYLVVLFYQKLYCLYIYAILFSERLYLNSNKRISINFLSSFNKSFIFTALKGKFPSTEWKFCEKYF